MLWTLRLFWYRLDKLALACALYFVLVVGVLAGAVGLVFIERDAQAAALKAFHARSVECLARNVYYEARGETAHGQYAVAEVTMNRKRSPLYPKTVCEVVYQRSAFSWTDEELDPPVGEEWLRAQKIAAEVYYQRRPAALPAALFYHATYVSPDWAKQRVRVARIGRHIFYR